MRTTSGDSVTVRFTRESPASGPPPWFLLRPNQKSSGKVVPTIATRADARLVRGEPTARRVNREAWQLSPIRRAGASEIERIVYRTLHAAGYIKGRLMTVASPDGPKAIWPARERATGRSWFAALITPAEGECDSLVVFPEHGAGPSAVVTIATWPHDHGAERSAPTGSTTSKSTRTPSYTPASTPAHEGAIN